MEPTLYPQARQANILVRSPLKLNHIEARIFALSLGCINSKSLELPQIRIPMLRVIPKSKSGPVYEQIDAACKTLMSKVVSIAKTNSKGKMNIKNYGIISFMEIDEGTGYVTGNFAPEIKPFLLELASEYTTVEIETILTLKSAHAHRLYWLLTSWDDVGSWEVELDTLREQMVGTEDTAYTIFYDFKRYVLEPAVKELQDIGWMVSWEPIKVGKKVGKVLFTIPKHVIAESTGPQTIDITPKGRAKQKQSDQLALGIISEMPTLHQRIVARLQKLQVTDAQIRTVLDYLGDDETKFTKLLKSTHQLLVNYETKSKVYDNIGGATINHLKTEIPGLFAKL
ncbi:replication initiation protein [Hymenobacter fodinae]|uniref:RepB family plasmid replication initiator protein n=1 Tax=Hymenobacter fodinae TaxID=2510796 RepID=A0A4Z0P085_9BACT|nr:replication initiation protein [Hymenobacter fodinae]TGE03858.1 RepB family plasmid replication initiator protein [Hymenobacter fodinae]